MLNKMAVDEEKENVKFFLEALKYPNLTKETIDLINLRIQNELLQTQKPLIIPTEDNAKVFSEGTEPFFKNLRKKQKGE